MSKRKGSALAQVAKEWIWLWDVRNGVSTGEIALREGLSPRRVRQGIARAQADEKSLKGDTADTNSVRPPLMVPLFPIGPFTPQSACAHRGPIKRGAPFVCMVCFTSGRDDHPALQRDPATDPKPEPDPASTRPPTKKTQAKQTRKQRRARMFGAASILSDETPAATPVG
jgi:hypothetical protein